MSNRIDVDDVYFVGSVQDIHSDGDTPTHRLRQAPDRRFIVWEENGWVYFRARHTIMVPRSNIKHMKPMTPERSKQLGPNPLEKAQEKGK